MPASEFGRILRVLGERGLLEAVAAVVVARPPTMDFTRQPPAADRRAHRNEQRDTAISVVGRYSPDTVVLVGPPFGHTRPQWILPYGGTMTVDGHGQRLFAQYD